MKIGVDARLLSRPITGIGRYTSEMCRVLSNTKEVLLNLYSPAPLNPNIVSQLGPATITTSASNNRIFRQYWSEIILPQKACHDQLDLFWGPAHRLPRHLPARMARVVTIHDLVWQIAGQTMRPLSRLLESVQVPAAIKNADHIVTDSQATATAIINAFQVNPEQLTVIPLGCNHLVPAENKKVLETLGIVKPYCLFVGTFEPRKNLENLLRAYAKLPDQIKENNHLVIAGGKGWGGIDPLTMIQSLNLMPYVKILNYVNETILSTLYTYARFLVMPSLYEGFGLPLVEAMACGTPVLTSNNSSMIEVAGNAGILVDPLNIESIKSGLQELMTNDTLHHNLAQNANSLAAHFNWQQSGHALLNVFKKAIQYRGSLS